MPTSFDSLVAVSVFFSFFAGHLQFDMGDVLIGGKSTGTNLSEKIAMPTTVINILLYK